MKKKPVPAKGEKKFSRRQVMLDSADAKRIDALAAERGQFTSAYLREMVIQHLNRIDRMGGNNAASLDQ